ncbi:hypothetical protein G6K91_31570 [Agrobacterium rhizogenes]|nr:hypothetical protein [Rhizobium rhizogenes]NTG57943.1 hypothetical protein [Rhizobium rhizogenes]NTH04137.1 hypothetical protein [Rhizobium rhizogenes]NTI59861.1 hypothetical protein [Rhizobium rhizogenes]
MQQDQRCECGKTSVLEGATHLCVDCFYKLQVAQTLQLRNAAIGMNYAAREMDFVSGLPGFTPLMQVPELPKAPMTLNNIKVDNSVVGSINTGEVGTIDVSITVLEQAGNKELSEALKRLTEAVVNSALGKDDKDTLIDQVAYLSEQAASAAKNRKPGMIRAALNAINDTVTKTATTVTTVAAAWHVVGPIITEYFFK